MLKSGTSEVARKNSRMLLALPSFEAKNGVRFQLSSIVLKGE